MGKRDLKGESVSQMLQQMAVLLRWTNLAVLDDKLTAGSLVVLVSHGLLAACTAAYVLLHSRTEYVFNDIGALISAHVSFSFMLYAVLQRHKLRRLHQELLQYCREVESWPSGSFDRDLLKPLPTTLRRLCVGTLVVTLLIWAFYTVSPLVFELYHGIPLGSKRRLSAMMWPTCDLQYVACYWLTFSIVAIEWFWAALAFGSAQAISRVHYTTASRLFQVLGSTISRIYSRIERDVLRSNLHDALEAESLLRQCVQQHQFLLRWSKEMTGVFSTPMFWALGEMVILIALSVAKSLLSRDYVLDEMPFVGLYGLQAIYVICLFADELNWRSAQIHESVYQSNWLRGSARFRTTLHILMTRSLKPVLTRAVLVDNVSLLTFVDVLRRSQTFYQTIRAARQRGPVDVM